MIEVILKLENLSSIFYSRHFLNHALFLVALYFFYLICLELFKNRYLAYFGTILLYTTPRIFAHSFYNGKDLAFLSFFIIAVYYAIKCFKNLNYKNSFLLALCSALAMNLRIVAIYVPLLLSCFIFMDCMIKNQQIKEKIKYLLIIIVSSILILVLTFPFLWENPIIKFLEVLSVFSKFYSSIYHGLSLKLQHQTL